MSFVVRFVFFFFKQKTAYEMRISDWSSDVCSSDLSERHRRCGRAGSRRPRHATVAVLGGLHQDMAVGAPDPAAAKPGTQPHCLVWQSRQLLCRRRARYQERSEEHTSELQSLMRISYAVFCLKKKKTIQTNTTH